MIFRGISKHLVKDFIISRLIEERTIIIKKLIEKYSYRKLSNKGEIREYRAVAKK